VRKGGGEVGMGEEGGEGGEGRDRTRCVGGEAEGRSVREWGREDGARVRGMRGVGDVGVLVRKRGEGGRGEEEWSWGEGGEKEGVVD